MNSKNVVAAGGGADELVSSLDSRALVGLREISLQQLLATWHTFKAELREALCDAFSLSPAEFSDWHRSSMFDLDRGVVGADCCIGFKPMSAAAMRLHYLKQNAVVGSLMELGLLTRTHADGRPRTRMPWGDGSLSSFCQQLPRGTQRELMRAVFADDARSLDDIVFISQTSLINTEAIDALMLQATDAETALNALAAMLSRFSIEQQTASLGGRGAGRHFAAVWFCAYLVREGYVLLPRFACSDEVLPRLLTPFLWTFFVPAPARGLAEHMSRRPGSNAWQYVLGPLRSLVLNTTPFI